MILGIDIDSRWREMIISMKRKRFVREALRLGTKRSGSSNCCSASKGFRKWMYLGKTCVG